MFKAADCVYLLWNHLKCIKCQLLGTLHLLIFPANIDIDDCAGVTCENGGTCVDGVNTYTCECATGFDGQHCENSMYLAWHISLCISRQYQFINFSDFGKMNIFQWSCWEAMCRLIICVAVFSSSMMHRTGQDRKWRTSVCLYYFDQMNSSWIFFHQIY